MTEETTTIVKDMPAGEAGAKEEYPEAETKKIDGYIKAVGRRKTSTAQVRISPASKTKFTINGKDLETYFGTEELQKIVRDAIHKVKLSRKFEIGVLVKGGGTHAQAEAIRHGIARSLLKLDENLRKKLKDLGFLKRDPRQVERKKPGLRKARKKEQWKKR